MIAIDKSERHIQVFGLLPLFITCMLVVVLVVVVLRVMVIVVMVSVFVVNMVAQQYV